MNIWLSDAPSTSTALKLPIMVPADWFSETWVLSRLLPVGAELPVTTTAFRTGVRVGESE